MITTKDNLVEIKAKVNEARGLMLKVVKELEVIHTRGTTLRGELNSFSSRPTPTLNGILDEVLWIKGRGDDDVRELQYFEAYLNNLLEGFDEDMNTINVELSELLSKYNLVDKEDGK